MSFITKSPWMIHYDGSSCNGCDIEVLACLTPRYDLERFGIINTGNPKHADILLATGSVNEQNAPVLMQIYEQMPEPKVVVAVGICAASGGIFKDSYNIKGGIDTVIPVDVYAPGCAARPEAIIDGVIKGIEVLGEKQKEMAENAVAVASETFSEGGELSNETSSAAEDSSLFIGIDEYDIPGAKEEIEIQYFGVPPEEQHLYGDTIADANYEEEADNEEDTDNEINAGKDNPAETAMSKKEEE